MMEQTNEMRPQVPRRVLASLLSSLSAGVVPRSGAPYIAIGRQDEISAFLSDLEQASEGGGSMRFLIGRYGSGKSFLMQLVRGYALERNFLTADADLSPERRFHGRDGAGLATYRELMKNLSSKAAPDGGALPKILNKWIGGIEESLALQGVLPDSAAFLQKLTLAIASELRAVEDFVGGFDFSRVLTLYYNAYQSDDDDKKSAALRWLRGEYATKWEAREELGIRVSSVIDDDNWYDYIKLWASLSSIMGYRGLVVFVDECVNLYKIPHRISRENNYEKILSMFNDTLQGKAPHLAMILGGTPQFLEDTRRGLFSYEALRSRLSDGRFTLDGARNLMGPVIRLVRLSDEELYALLKRVTILYGEYYGEDARVRDEDIEAFLRLSLARAGSDSMVTPREMLRDYMTILQLLYQNKSCSFAEVLASAAPATAQESGAAAEGDKKFTIDDIEF